MYFYNNTNFGYKKINITRLVIDRSSTNWSDIATEQSSLVITLNQNMQECRKYPLSSLALNYVDENLYFYNVSTST